MIKATKLLIVLSLFTFASCTSCTTYPKVVTPVKGVTMDECKGCAGDISQELTDEINRINEMAKKYEQ